MINVFYIAVFVMAGGGGYALTTVCVNWQFMLSDINPHRRGGCSSLSGRGLSDQSATGSPYDQ